MSEYPFNRRPDGMHPDAGQQLDNIRRASGVQAAPGGDLARSIISTANRLGISPQHLATVISYETAGTFDPWKAGQTTQWGQHRGLIQWGEPQRQQYGVTQDMPVSAQMQAVGDYLKDAGVKPGMGLVDIYSAVNAGSVGRNNASDANNGGAPGTVADKVNYQMGPHADKAAALLASAGQPAPPAAPDPSPAPMQLPGGLLASAAPQPPAATPSTTPNVNGLLASLQRPQQQAQQEPDPPMPHVVTRAPQFSLASLAPPRQSFNFGI